ncbi:ABC transporter permease [Hydrogenoanaerobacterium sp.]|uniref:ABC transporter permease n=1 Tax=Hydrogenoanaerobacterium sp. TaxID=2953763 RepID=UPI00289B7945|nr:ABC transporter permease [Hydrogenoanaerobacterium sp.]
MGSAKVKAVKTAKDIEKQFNMLRMLLAVGIALGVAFLIIVFISDNPMGAIKSFMFGPVSTMRRMGNLIEVMTPLLFTGVAVCLIFSANQTNMSVEGGFLVGAVGATIVATKLTLPGIIHPIVSIALGGVFGAIVCFIPAILYVKCDAKPVVSSLMMNYVCLYFSLGIINHILRDPAAGFLASFKFAETSRLSRLLPGTSIHSGIIIALVVATLGYFYLYKSKRGYEIRMVGKNPEFSAYSGIPVKKVLLNAQILGGFVAGMGGAVEVLGMYKRFQYQGLTNHGFDGILVGIIAGYNPKLVPLAAAFLAYVRVGADVMARTDDIPIELVSIIQAIIIMLVVAERFLHKLKHKKLVEAAEKQLSIKEVAVNGQ